MRPERCLCAVLILLVFLLCDNFVLHFQLNFFWWKYFSVTSNQPVFFVCTESTFIMIICTTFTVWYVFVGGGGGAHSNAFVILCFCALSALVCKHRDSFLLTDKMKVWCNRWDRLLCAGQNRCDTSWPWQTKAEAVEQRRHVWEGCSWMWVVQSDSI